MNQYLNSTVGYIIGFLIHKEFLITEKLLLQPIATAFYSIKSFKDKNTKAELNESDLEKCLRDISNLVASNENEIEFFDCLDTIVIEIFELHCMATKLKSHFKSQTWTILRNYFKWSSKASNSFRKILTTENNVVAVLDFSLAPNGGVQIGSKGNVNQQKSYFSNEEIEYLIDILKEIEDNSIIGDLFVDIMSDFTKLFKTEDQGTQEKQEQPQLQLSLLNALVLMTEKLGPAVFVNVVQICILLRTLLLANADEEITLISLNLLDQLLSGIIKIKKEEEVIVFDLLEPLERISETCPNQIAAEIAAKLYKKISERSPDWTEMEFEGTQDSNTNESNKNDKTANKAKKRFNDYELPSIQDILRELSDPLLPVRAHGLICLRKLVLSKSQIAQKNLDKILGIFQNQINEEDEYVYGNAIQGLNALADIFPEKIIPILVTTYKNDKHSQENKLKLGEALLLVARKLGQVLPKYSDLFMNCFLDTLEKSKSNIIRASALSNIAQFCKILKFSLQPYIIEILAVISNILTFEKDDQVRRGAVFVIHFLFRGVGVDVLQLVSSRQLQEIYERLKLIYNSDSDEVTKFHANQAILEYQRILRLLMTPDKLIPKWLELN